ncbi:uncharacterized protein LOC128191629 [Crassostrea angulata]|uniref:uncharacterized protein LOC128191629 n=1 Tax=Magallana angulata TaxID=2784310 RepID=UPI0022B106CE|nr:uncharacterized protein LOC128191629 [Crassostrea angulata]
MAAAITFEAFGSDSSAVFSSQIKDSDSYFGTDVLTCVPIQKSYSIGYNMTCITLYPACISNTIPKAVGNLFHGSRNKIVPIVTYMYMMLSPKVLYLSFGICCNKLP